MPGDPLSAPPGPAGPESQPSTSLGPQLGFDRQGVLEISAGAVVALIALSSSNGASASSLPRWRSWLSMLNWRRDPDYERRMNALESEIAQIKSEAEQIKKETELIKQETERLRLQNARGRQWLASIDALSLPDASSSTLCVVGLRRDYQSRKPSRLLTTRLRPEFQPDQVTPIRDIRSSH
jgi:hypothetical protein